MSGPHRCRKPYSDTPRAPSLALPDTSVKFSDAPADSMGRLSHRCDKFKVIEVATEGPSHKGMKPYVWLHCVNPHAHH